MSTPIVTRAITPAYRIDPWTGRPVASWASANDVARQPLARGFSVATRFPWTPYSYPSVGREPGSFPPPAEWRNPPGGSP